MESIETALEQARQVRVKLEADSRGYGMLDVRDGEGLRCFQAPGKAIGLTNEIAELLRAGGIELVFIVETTRERRDPKDETVIAIEDVRRSHERNRRERDSKRRRRQERDERIRAEAAKRDGNGDPLWTQQELAARWNLSQTRISRIIGERPL